MPLFGDDVVSGAGPLKSLFFVAVAAKHVDEAFVVANCLVGEVLIWWITLFAKHKFVLVVEQEHLWSVYQEDGIV